jgi:DNA-binding CsgD family transcriptional regulator
MKETPTLREKKEPLALTPGEREALSLYYGNKSISQIAAVMGIHKGTVLFLIRSAEKKQNYLGRGMSRDLEAAAKNFRVIEVPALIEAAEPKERWAHWPFKDRSPERLAV